jgi:hypothetical protein
VPISRALNLPIPQLAHTPCPIGKRRIVIGGPPLPQETLVNRPTPVTSDSIERMQAHRKQLSAETGQLERRVKRAASASSKPSTPAAASDSGSDTTDSRGVSWPSSKSESCATPLRIRCEANPVPTSVGGMFGPRKVPPTAWTQKTDDLVEEKLAESKYSTPTSTVSLTPRNLSHLNENHRKVNDGFEILPAGTLAKPAAVKEFGLWPEQSINFVPGNDTRPARKLQKRNRSRSGSRSRRSSSDGAISDKEN